MTMSPSGEPAHSSHHCDAQGAQGVKGPTAVVQVLSSRGRPKQDARMTERPSRILSDCMYMWERTVMGISVHTAETEMATTSY